MMHSRLSTIGKITAVGVLCLGASATTPAAAQPLIGNIAMPVFLEEITQGKAYAGDGVNKRRYIGKVNCWWAACTPVSQRRAARMLNPGDQVTVVLDNTKKQHVGSYIHID